MKKIDGISFKYDIGQVIKSSKSSYKIIDYEIVKKKNREPRYICKCLNDNYIFERRTSEINKKYNCPICSHSKTVLGYNTIFDTRPELTIYFENKDDAKKYSEFSNNQTWMICPICGFRKYMYICSLSTYGFSCPQCSDGVSYPNKFIRALLKQLNIKYTPEKTFDWDSKYLYDEYLPDYNMIIENHGEQHYDNRNVWGRNTKENDKVKKECALKNGITEYIEIDCSESNMTYIKKSIMNSELPHILNFTEQDVNWNECELKASSSLLVKACALWNQGCSYEEIMKALDICYDTVHVYLRRGRKINLISSLNIDEHLFNNIKYRNAYNGKPIYCINDSIYFANTSLCVAYYNDLGIKLNASNICRSIKTNGTTKGKKFKHISKKEFNELFQKSTNNSDINIIGEQYRENIIKKYIE